MNPYDAPFPQANDFEKILKIVNIDNEDRLRDYSSMQIYLGDISDRQVDYYISACVYLGVLTKNKVFSQWGQEVRQLVGIEQLAEIARCLLYDKVFGTVYYRQALLGSELDKSDVVEIMKENISFDSEEMYNRRASTVISWVRWFKQQLNG